MKNANASPDNSKRSSNNYFPVVESALSIPPWDDSLKRCRNRKLGRYCLNANNEALIKMAAGILERKVGISRRCQENYQG